VPGHSHDISHSLTRLNLLVSGTALVLAGIAFATYDLFTFRDYAVHQTAAQAELTAALSEKALQQGDRAAAAATLSTLRRSPDVLAASLLTADGQALASYQRTSAVAIPDIALSDGGSEHTIATMRSVAVARRVTVDGRAVGTVVIAASLDSVYARLQRSLLIVAGVLLVSLVAALLVSRLAQRAISTPLVALAAVARRVSQERDYSIRAPEPPGLSYEVQTAIRAFNEMLAQIESRDLSRFQQRVRQFEGQARRAEIGESAPELGIHQRDGIWPLHTRLVMVHDDAVHTLFLQPRHLSD
jgi:hypothetical protein